jgi:hypothetical protein
MIFHPICFETAPLALDAFGNCPLQRPPDAISFPSKSLDRRLGHVGAQLGAHGQEIGPDLLGNVVRTFDRGEALGPRWLGGGCCGRTSAITIRLVAVRWG